MMASRIRGALVTTTTAHQCRRISAVISSRGPSSSSSSSNFVQCSGTNCQYSTSAGSLWNNNAGVFFPQHQVKAILLTSGQQEYKKRAALRRNLWSKSTREEEEERKLGIIPSTTTTTTTSGRSSNEKDGNKNDNDNSAIILFDRGPGRLRVMSMGFGFSSFNTMYWLWYSTCFVPAINASPITEISIDPMLPTIGIVFSVIIQSVFTLYPRFLISRLTWSPTTNDVSLYTHTVLPYVQADLNKPFKVVPVGELQLDPTSKEAKQIVEVYGGDLRRFKGHAGITTKTGRQWPPFMLDFSGPAAAATTTSSSSSSAVKHHHNDVPEPEILLELLLDPQAIIRDFNAGDGIITAIRRPSYRVQVARGAAAAAVHRNKRTSSSSSSSSSNTNNKPRRAGGGESRLRQIAKQRRR
jgi:hypothetical protein